MRIECLFCGKTAKYTCDGCGEPFCGHCSSKKVVISRLGHATEQRLCALCALREQDNGNTRTDNVCDRPYYTVEQVQEWLDIRVPQKV